MLSNCGAEKTPMSALDYREIKPVNPKGNQPWIFIGRTHAEGEAPILWPPDAKSQLIKKRHWWWERLRAGGAGDDGGWDYWRASSTQWTSVWANEAWCAAVHGVTKSQMWLSDWITATTIQYDWYLYETLGHRRGQRGLPRWCYWYRACLPAQGR